MVSAVSLPKALQGTTSKRQDVALEMEGEGSVWLSSTARTAGYDHRLCCEAGSFEFHLDKLASAHLSGSMAPDAVPGLTCLGSLMQPV